MRFALFLLAAGIASAEEPKGEVLKQTFASSTVFPATSREC